jgi:hypothetical protein
LALTRTIPSSSNGSANKADAKGDPDRMKIKAPTYGMVLYNDYWNERRKLRIGDLVWPR